VRLLGTLLPFVAGVARAAPPNDACDDAKEVPEEAMNRYFDTLDLPTTTIAPGDASTRLANAVD